jgi:hypothetical protein
MIAAEVPYFSLAQRTIGIALSATAMLAGILAARLTIAESNVLPFIVISIVPALLVLAVWRYWCSRSSPRMTRSERQRRYAIEMLQAPYWKALLIQGAPATMTPLALVALHSNSASNAARLLLFVLPIAYLAAAATLYFQQRRARRLLGEAAV